MAQYNMNMGGRSTRSIRCEFIPEERPNKIKIFLEKVLAIFHK